MSNEELINTFVLLALTIPILIGYIIAITSYVFKMDKKYKLLNGNNSNPGLSKIMLCAIYFLFGIIICDTISEFTALFIQKYKILSFNIIIYDILSNYRDVPIDILIKGAILATGIYTGTEGVIASFKTLSLNSGLKVELPQHKRRRLVSFFYIWSYLTIVSTVYDKIIGSEIYKFNVFEIRISLIIILCLLFLAERSPSALESFHMKNKNEDKEEVVEKASVVNKLLDVCEIVANKVETVSDHNNPDDYSDVVLNTNETTGADL